MIFLLIFIKNTISCGHQQKQTQNIVSKVTSYFFYNLSSLIPMAIKKVIKRNGSEAVYNPEKIRVAIQKANHEVPEDDQASDFLISEIIRSLELAKKWTVPIEEIQDFIEMQLIKMNKAELAKKYIIYRYQRALVRKSNTTDDSILTLIHNDNKEVGQENSNKDASIASTQRDLIAWEVSKDLTRRMLLPDDIREAHDEGVLHFHDMDYFIQPIFNCCLVNIKDMFENGTVMNGKLVETPKSFQVACTVMTQIIASVASSQYGGQSVNIKHLGKYLYATKQKYLKKYKESCPELSDEEIQKIVDIRVKDELASWVQTIQYQINTLMTTNGQSPFVTLFLELDEKDEYIQETAEIIEEIFKQRLQGIKNEVWVYVTPAFPKLVYVLDECNILKGGKYDYLTKLAVKCSAKRMYPDYISAKKMREIECGNVFAPMGCRSFLAPWKDENWEYKFEGRFNQWVVTINLPQIWILANHSEEKYFKLLDERLELCRKALMCRHERLKGTVSDISPIHWQYWAIARLKKGEKIDKYLYGWYSTISLGYIGLYESSILITWEPHTTEKGQAFALKVMRTLKAAVTKWKEESGIGFALYGTPAESLCYRFAKIDRKKFGEIKDVTDKWYYTNSYHVDVREHIDALSKLAFEAQFQSISTWGAISYIEMPNMQKNLPALESLVQFMYDNIMYAEFNTKSDYCHCCGFDGEIIVNEDNEWECPQCHNKNQRKMNVTRRTCWYLGENFWNAGKTKEISKRVLHVS